jgi:hypothetical protein
MQANLLIHHGLLHLIHFGNDKSKHPHSPVKELLKTTISNPFDAFKLLRDGYTSAAHLAEEDHNIRAAIEKEKQKMKQSRRQMTPNKRLCVHGARNLIQARNERGNEVGGI